MSVKASPVHRKMSMTTHEAVNFSTAKQKFSFGKEARFPSVGRGTPTDFTHSLTSTLKKRSAGFGLGDRFVRRSSNSPCPGSYELGTSFREDNPVYTAHPATNWGKRCSRDAYSSTLTPGKMVGLRGENPGPGTYSYKNMSVGKDAKKFSFRRRTINHTEPEYHMVK